MLLHSTPLNPLPPFANFKVRFLHYKIIKNKFTGFGGCIRDLRKTRPYTELIDVIRILKEAQTVNLDGCPPFYIPPKTCRDSLIEDIYNGTQLSYNDMGLQPYSG